MSDIQVVGIGRQGSFTLADARALLPLVRSITEKYRLSVEKKFTRLEALDPVNIDLISEIEATVNLEIKEWHEKINKLGAKAKGLWLVDFDSGNGYFCWKFPERDILFWHTYTDGFSGRIPVQEIPEFVRNSDLKPVSSSENIVSTPT